MTSETTIRTIMVGTDLSPVATNALAWAGALARDCDAELIPVAGFDTGSSKTTPAAAATVREVIRRSIDEDVAKLGLSDVGRPAIVELADARMLIPEMIDREHADLLVVGRTGAGGFAGLKFGGTAGHLAHNVHCPIAIVPPGVDASDGSDWVIGVDGSDANRAALGWLVQLSERVGSDIHAVHVFDPLVGPSSVPWFEPNEAVGIEGQAARDLVDELSGSRPISFERFDGHRIPGLLSAADKYDARGIVVGAKGTGSLRGLRLGRVPTQLMHHSECPVIIVKTSADE